MAKNNSSIKFLNKGSSYTSTKDFFFLSQQYKLSEIGWGGDNDRVEKLWRYNQHYFDDLLSLDAFDKVDLHDELLTDWVEKNVPFLGVGWAPYPTSLRIINWIKYCLQGNSLKPLVLASLKLQVNWLSKNLEFHILGNHLFTNAKALFFAGLYFEGEDAKRWLSIGIKIIEEELKEQVFEDGGHFELSPMYHCLFLEDILDLINLSASYDNQISRVFLSNLKLKAQVMIGWLNNMTHQDGKISLFNDAAFNIAQDPLILNDYARKLGVVTPSRVAENKTTWLEDSGYVRVSRRNMLVLIDVAKVGPDYLPGHAHADTLSFELSLFGHRVFVNSGTSTYEDSQQRSVERSTKCHNTVEVNGESSSEVWSAFRVARRAYPIELSIREEGQTSTIECGHTGYQRIARKTIHRRTWIVKKSELTVLDLIHGGFHTAVSRFHLHPDVVITETNSSFAKIRVHDHHVIFIVELGKLVVEPSIYCPEFGKLIRRKCLAVYFESNNKTSVKIVLSNDVRS